MLDPTISEICDDLSRLAVLRSQDVLLLSDITQKTHEDRRDTENVDDVTFQHMYRSLLCEEVRTREVQRRHTETKLMSRLVSWEQSLADMSGNSARAKIRQEWDSQHVLQPVLLQTMREAYGLRSENLSQPQSPLAAVPPAAALYSTASTTHPLIQQAQSHVFGEIGSSGEDGDSGVRALLAELFPLTKAAQGEKMLADAETVPDVRPETREALLTTRRQWQVLCLLWLHTTVLADGATKDALEAALGPEWTSVLSNTARTFLNTQENQLHELLSETLRGGGSSRCEER